MKTIQDVQIWVDGTIKIAKVLNAFATNVNLNNNANFQYVLFSLNDDETINESISSNNIYMPTEDYLQWNQDEFAWDFVASSLNLVITGDYIPPVVEPIVKEALDEEIVQD